MTDILGLLQDALQNLFSLDHFIYLILGVVIGMIVGILPGLGGITGLSLLLPFIYGMDQVSALAMLIGLVAVISTSASFTSILMGIPGSSSSQATVLDGFALAKAGQASRALSAAFLASLFGGLFGAIILTFFVQIARPVILFFGSAELFMLAIFGLSMVGALAGKSLIKGLLACGLGLLVGSIGAAPATGEFRMVFGLDYLYDGMPLVVIGLAIFAFPEILELFRINKPISEEAELDKGGWRQGLKDLWQNKGLALRCSGLGTIIGAIPGMGGSVVDWIAYGHAVQTSKDKSKYGKGDIRGVIAPESANNAKEGGALMPTLLFGIPGSGGMAVFLGGIVLIGLEAGPSMLTKDIGITYTIVWSLAVANVIGAGLSLFLAGPISKLTKIRFGIIAPFMIMIICFASYQATKDMIDLWMLFIFGVAAIFMKRFGWSRPAFLIGFVLAPQAESYLNMSIQFYGWGMFIKPGVIIILLISLVSMYFSRRGIVDESQQKMEKVKLRSGYKMLPQIIFAASVFIFFAISFADSIKQSFLGGIFPMAISGILLPFALWLVWGLYKKKSVHPANFDSEVVADEEYHTTWYEPVFWVLGLYLGTLIIGFIPSIIIFFVTILTLKAKTNWLMTTVLTLAAIVMLFLFQYFLNVEFPTGLIL